MKPDVESRFWAKVDKNGPNGCWVWVAAKMSNGYGVFGIDGNRTCLAHRFSFESAQGKIPEGIVLDHVCHNRSCVNPSHLRTCSLAENGKNQNLREGSKSGFKGVSWHSGAGRWRATVTIAHKQVHLGFFDDPALAHLAYCEAADRFHGTFANHGDQP